MPDFEETRFDTLIVFLVTAVLCLGIWFFGESPYPALIAKATPMWLVITIGVVILLGTFALDFWEN